MDYDKLVDLIVNEVCKKLSIKEEKENNNKEKVVVLWEKDLNNFKQLKSEYNVSCYNEKIEECDILIISKLCLRGLSNMSLGISVSNEERFILSMLMQGKKVYALEEGLEYRKYKKTAPKALYNKFIDHEENIKTYGIQIIKNIEDIQLKNKPLYNNQPIGNEEVVIKDLKNTGDDYKFIDLTTKKLISESDLKKPHLNGIKIVHINKKCIVTPLANDFIRIYHLQLKRI
ncbi:ethanolamine utilization protein [Romboutsia maritimum]|uniref:Ethanolamine utilization protein n=1 Tax=Romboutsia maritimum TaxID=2020948 RepID=A0A371ISN5_9FIRM|nr:TIGR02536 family ethanolamine utilization protein [Romboutsia maritimum]RDY23491.1 ethanolamine utilization protein [Romboutsia maritimum]